MIDPGVGKELLDTTPKAKSIKGKFISWTSLKFKTFTLYKTTKRMKTQSPTGRIFVNHISVKGLVSRIHKELSKLNNKKTTILKWGKGLNRYFTKGVCITNKHLERCSTSFIRKMQIETTMTYKYILNRMTKF